MCLLYGFVKKKKKSAACIAMQGNFWVLLVNLVIFITHLMRELIVWMPVPINIIL